MFENERPGQMMCGSKCNARKNQTSRNILLRKGTAPARLRNEKSPHLTGALFSRVKSHIRRQVYVVFRQNRRLVYCHFHSSLPLFSIGTISEALTRSPAVSLHRILFACILTQILYDTYNFILYLLNFLCHPFGFPPFDFRFATAGSHHHYINRNLFQYLSLKFHVARGPSAGGAIQKRGGV